jgi:membrane fusion protein, multidrug efflux system
MQTQRLSDNDVYPRSSRMVGARGANAARRAAKGFDFGPVAAAIIDDRGGQAIARLPVAQHSDAPVEHQSAGKSLVSRAGRMSRKAALISAAAVVALVAGGWYGGHWLTTGRFIVSTDDAYVRADATTLAAKISGYVSAIGVADNTYVHSGDVIARIDEGDYQLAVDTARDKLATQQATVARIGKQIEAQKASVEQAKAQVTSAQAVQTRTQSELQRQKELASREFASRQTLEQAQSNRDQAVAGVQSAQAALDSAVANVDVLTAQQQEATRQQQELKTALAKAERDLSFTVVRAPVDGVIGNRAMRVGDFVQTGQRLASVVPLAGVYVDANFKETQLAHLQPGQPVRISVDALPNHDITGTVASVSPASGSMFSLLPPDNATGNFTKIVQRLAVRIQLPANVTDQRVLRPGMSVVVGVNTKPQAKATADRGWSTASDIPHWQAARW